MSRINTKKKGAFPAVFFSRSGFTLAELIVVITVLSIMAMVTAPLIKVAVEAVGVHTVQAELEETGNLVLAKLGRDLRSSDEWKIDSTVSARMSLSSTTREDPPSQNYTSDRFIYALQTADSTLRVTRAATFYTFIPGKGYQTRTTSYDSSLADNVKALTFECLAADGTAALACSGSSGKFMNAYTTGLSAYTVWERIKIRVILEKGGQTVDMETTIRPRKTAHEAMRFP
ncbi:MAG: type II secretion system protein [Candidatus Omnitrophica bacterium]|nr:type II secretion system protein [Candidatus Omnitrophota bacterium]